MFSKKDLKTGMILVFSDGSKCMVLLDTHKGDIVSGDKWFNLDTLSNDLYRHKYYVDEIWQPKFNHSFLSDWNRPDLFNLNYEKIWGRYAESPLQVKKRELIEKYEAVKKELVELGKQIGEV